MPAEDFQGKSAINAYADYVMQVDATVGRVLETLDRNDLTDHTLIVFTSDNGCSPTAKFDELAAHGHDPSYHFRGHKADIYEGGHRIPFLVRWPGKVAPGSSYDHPVCLTDFMATCAEALGVELPDDAAEDSVSLLPALLGKAEGKPIREAVVHHSINGSFAIRQGNWKLCLCPGSGGWSYPRPGRDHNDALPPVQLYDLAKDVEEHHNVEPAHQDVAERLTSLLKGYVSRGRSTPGRPLENEGEVNIERPSAR